MVLLDPSLPKNYKNKKKLFEENLDAWRLATQAALSIANLNFTQIAKDAFGINYEFDNDGANNLSQSLQEQINLLSSGGTPISGTTSDTFTINSDGNYVTLTTASLTGGHTYSFPDASGELVISDSPGLTTPELADPTITGTITMTTGPVKFDVASTYLWISQDAGTLPAIAANTLVLSNCSANGDNALMSLISGNTGVAGIYLGDTDSEISGYATYNNNTNKFSFGVNAGTVLELSATAVTLTTGLDLIIGATDKLFFDGGADTSIRESSANVITFQHDGSDVNSFSASYISTSASTNAEMFHQVINTSNTSAAQAYLKAQVAGGSAGDPFTLWQIASTTGFAMGPDNSDSDKLKVRYSATGATPSNGTSLFEMTTAGQLELPAGGILLPSISTPVANVAYRQSIVKAYAVIDGSGPTILESFNVASVSTSGAGKYNVVWDTDFVTTTPIVVANQIAFGILNTTYADRCVSVPASSKTDASVWIYDISGAAFVDGTFSVVAFGVQ